MAASADPWTAPQDRTAAPTGAAAKARQALTRAEAIFTTKPSDRVSPKAGRDATMVLRDLFMRLDDLSPADRRTARAILARPTTPTDPGLDGVEHEYTSPERVDCTTHFCVHWIDPLDAPSDPDAVVRATDGTDTGDVPVWVQTNEATLEHVWTKEVDDYGYQAPLSDEAAPEHGPDGNLDVYLENLPKGYYGYCTSDDPAAATTTKVSAYCVLDNDFTGFPRPPLQDLRVTAAHEFFHAIQFSYDAGEDLWLMEGTAAWMEDEVYDGINDNRQYLATSPIKNSLISLDDVRLRYGDWVYWRYLSESAGTPTIIRQIWQKAASPKVFSTGAVKAVLAARGTTFAKSFARFGVWNRVPAKFYSEGKAYPKSPLQASFTLTKAKPKTPVMQGTLDHMSTAYVRYTPGRTLTGARRFEIAFNLPDRSRGSAATLISYLRNGGTKVRTVSLNASGGGSARTDFTRSRVRYVEVVLSNAGSSFTCLQGTNFTCQGKSKDNNLHFLFQARTVR